MTGRVVDYLQSRQVATRPESVAESDADPFDFYEYTIVVTRYRVVGIVDRHGTGDLQTWARRIAAAGAYYDPFNAVSGTNFVALPLENGATATYKRHGSLWEISAVLRTVERRLLSFTPAAAAEEE